METYKIYIIAFVVAAILATGLGVGLTLGIKQSTTSEIEQLKEEIPKPYWDNNKFKIIAIPEQQDSEYGRNGFGIIAGTYIRTEPDYPIWYNSEILEGGKYSYNNPLPGKKPWNPPSGWPQAAFLVRYCYGPNCSISDYDAPISAANLLYYWQSADKSNPESIKQNMRDYPSEPGRWGIVLPNYVSMFDESVEPLPDLTKFNDE